MEFIGEDVAVYYGDECVGNVSECEARKMLAGRKAQLVRNAAGNIRKLVIDKPEVADKVRAMSLRDGSGSGALSTTYEESLYSVGTMQGPVKTAIVTNYCTTLKKVDRRTGTLRQYGEREGFRRRRFNPDLLPQPLIPIARNHAIPASWQ